MSSVETVKQTIRRGKPLVMEVTERDGSYYLTEPDASEPVVVLGGKSQIGNLESDGDLRNMEISAKITDIKIAQGSASTIYISLDEVEPAPADAELREGLFEKESKTVAEDEREADNDSTDSAQKVHRGKESSKRQFRVKHSEKGKQALKELDSYF